MESFQDIPWGLIAPLIGIQVILAIICIIDLTKQQETRGPKWMWVPIVLFVQMVGPVAYFIIGRKNT